ncbi:MAG: DUF294 nucleotidyltransferase-like domain-containing protein [Terriglobia bacterium]
MSQIVTTGGPAAVLAAEYMGGFERLKSDFAASGDGAAALRARTDLVNSIVSRLYAELISSPLPGPAGLCLAAVGGYGREELFPFSDVDLLFVVPDERGVEAHREDIAALAQSLWDARLRVAHSTRTLAGCGQLHQGNVAFSVSLLDVRYLAGNRAIFDELRSRTVPHLVARDRQDLLKNLLEAADQRHTKRERTIFHLEPDIKEAPGGLRDYHTARWLLALAGLAEHGRWKPDLWPREMQEKTAPAVRFLTALRCFLHFERGRNDNALSYEMQERAAVLGVGVSYGTPVEPARWMREYYLHVRRLHSLTAALIRKAQPERSALYGLFQDWRSRLSNADFSVIRGRVYPRAPAPGEVSTLLLMFEMLARHALELSGEAEAWAEASVKSLAAREAASAGAALWPGLRRILALRHAADALRAMHRLGVLSMLLPEFRVVDALVIRDFYHRYTVDEHSFMAIQHLCELDHPGRVTPQSGARSGGFTPPFLRWRDKPAATFERGAGDQSREEKNWEGKLGEIASEIERPDLLRMALLVHDVGKGMDLPGHIAGSLEALERVVARLHVDEQDAEILRFLIAHHLEMSSTLSRRDIFDPAVIASLGASAGSPERLKMLCLFTYADIKAVSPEALTPWKAELLWQLYAMTMNHLARSVDQERVMSPAERPPPGGILGMRAGADEGRELDAFLDGFPKRYLATHTGEEIAEHFRASRELRASGARARARRRAHANELMVIASDRPFLFSSIAGTLAGWGMNILKADAFANRAGIVVDVFRFHDPFRTLELNPSEVSRLESGVIKVIRGEISPEAILQGRADMKRPSRGMIGVPTQISFDDASSSRCTLLELITEDRPGLLYAISSALASLGCNIEVALIDTEAGKAIDVFYLTADGGKLSAERQQAVHRALMENALAP